MLRAKVANWRSVIWAARGVASSAMDADGILPAQNKIARSIDVRNDR